MPYVFSALVVLNLLAFGYFWATPVNDTGTLAQAEQSIERPLHFINNSANIPPLIGDK